MQKSQTLGYANLDLERKERTGFAEVVFCEGKTPEQTADIHLYILGIYSRSISVG